MKRVTLITFIRFEGLHIESADLRGQQSVARHIRIGPAVRFLQEICVDFPLQVHRVADREHVFGA